jgi:hypothetical protein
MAIGRIARDEDALVALIEIGNDGKVSAIRRRGLRHRGTEGTEKAGRILFRALIRISLWSLLPLWWRSFLRVRTDSRHALLSALLHYEED